MRAIVDAEQAYADITDELNDGTPGNLELGDFDASVVAAAARHADRHGLPWPPRVGDYDRLWEARQASRREAKR